MGCHKRVKKIRLPLPQQSVIWIATNWIEIEWSPLQQWPGLVRRGRSRDLFAHNSNLRHLLLEHSTHHRPGSPGWLQLPSRNGSGLLGATSLPRPEWVQPGGQRWRRWPRKLDGDNGPSNQNLWRPHWWRLQGQFHKSESCFFCQNSKWTSKTKVLQLPSAINVNLGGKLKANLGIGDSFWIINSWFFGKFWNLLNFFWSFWLKNQENLRIIKNYTSRK